MSTNKALQTLLTSYAHGKDTIVIRLLYKDMLGKLESAMVLSECEFWTGKGRNKEGWFYRTHDEWHDRTRLTRYKIDGAMVHINNVMPGVIEKKIMRVGGTPKAHYRVNFEALTAFVAVYLEAQNEQESTREKPTGAPESRASEQKVLAPSFEAKNAQEPAQGRTKAIKKTRTNPDIESLESFFERETGLRLSWAAPKRAQVLWRSPITRMLKAAGDNRVNCQAIMSRAIVQMRDDKLTISSPASIENVYISLAAEAEVAEDARRSRYTGGELADFISR